MRLPEYARYVALGDSVSMDLYPALDVGEIDVAVALERRASAGEVARLGAASLLYANDDARWPEFEGRDLRSHHPAIELVNLAADGATIGDVFGEQIVELGESDAEMLVTLTVGGNDLLSAASSHPDGTLLDRIVLDVTKAYAVLVRAVGDACPSATIVLSTVYDPSDRQGHLPGVLGARPLPLQHLDALNAGIRSVAASTPNALLADVYAHFLGHGASVDVKEQWYWRRSVVEPAALGASEIRRVWLEAIEGG
ncbi:MAG: hypothetical protein NVS1B4_03110 [Gemmatimonadaceae bacterium]